MRFRLSIDRVHRRFFAVMTSVLVGALVARADAAAAEGGVYRSPFDVAFSPDGKTLAVADRTAGCVAIINAADNKILREVAVKGEPTGLVWAANGARLYLADYQTASVVEIDPAAGKILRRFGVGHSPMGLAIAAKRNLLLAANTGTHDVAVIHLADGKQRARIPAVREPYFVAVTPDESLAVVANLLPADPATDPRIACVVTLIDLEKCARVADIRLPAGSITVRCVAISADGRWGYAVHTVGRFSVPTTQLERGWINTNAVSIIDLKARQLFATLLLDSPSEGAADPWDIVLSKNGATAWITLSGVHKIARIDLAGLHKLLEGKIEKPPAPGQPDPYSTGTQSIWLEVKKDPKARARLVNDLSALHAADLIVKTPLPCKGPRGLDLAPDGKTLAVAAYYSGQILRVDSATGKVTATVCPGPARKPDIVRRGEIAFHDATQCFQQWLSCATCHPDGRADGLNWDLLNDGIGNPKNTKSLLLSDKTPPAMSRGVRTTMEEAALAGFHHILFREPSREDVEAVEAYLRAMKPRFGPCRPADGSLSPGAVRGKGLFESNETRCATCHPAPLYTNLEPFDVGTRGELDRAEEFDTPTLTEIWRTGPYLHDGSAATLRDVLTKCNKNDKHGRTSHLTKEQLDDLIEFLGSL